MINQSLKNIAEKKGNSTKKLFDVELLLKTLDHTFYKGNGKWIATCPACRSKEKTLLIRNEFITTDEQKTGLSKYGTFECANLCSAGSIVSQLGLNSSSLFFEETKQMLSFPDDYEWLMPPETALAVLNEEIQLFGRDVDLQNLCWDEKFSLYRMHFIYVGLKWILRSGSSVLGTSNPDSQNPKENWGFLDV